MPGRACVQCGWQELDGSRAVAVIPARGGSKGIPRKNLQTVNGVSLIARAVKTCVAASQLSGVWVSTDDYEMALAGQAAGASTVCRPAGLAADTAATVDVLWHALEVIYAAKKPPAVLCLVQCTAPLLTAVQIDRTIERLVETGADVAVAAVDDHSFGLREGYDGRVYGVGWDLGEPVKRRQDMAPRWAVAGSVWAIDVAFFLRERRIYSANTVICPVPEKLDIDTPADLQLAELILRDREGPAAKTRRAESVQVYSPD